MYGKIKEHLQKELQTIEDNGIFKKKESLLHHKGRLQFQQEKLF
jgi:glycine C-acetyltransferase